MAKKANVDEEELDVHEEIRIHQSWHWLNISLTRQCNAEREGRCRVHLEKRHPLSFQGVHND